MFMEQKILSGNIPQKDLQIQHKLYQNPSCTFCRNWHTLKFTQKLKKSKHPKQY